MATQITFRRGSNDPTSASGLTLAEPAFNYANQTLWIGMGGSTAPVWIGAGICGEAGGIAAGLSYSIPTAKAVKDYSASLSGTNVFTALNSFNAGICASGITISSGIVSAPGSGLYLSSLDTKNAKLNLLGGPSSSQIELDAITVRVRNTTDGALPTFELYEATDVYSAKMQYASSATNDATITFPAITGTVALTNQIVTSFNGKTGAVTGASLGANTFTGTQTLTAGLTTSYLYASGGSTFASTLQVNGGATFSSRTDFAGNNNFATGLTAAGTLNTTSNIKFNGSTSKSIRTTQAPLTISGATVGASTGDENSIIFGVQTNTPLTLTSTTGTVVFTTSTAGLNPSLTSLTLSTDDANVYGPQTVVIGPSTYLTASRTLTVPDDSGTIALTKNVVSSFNGLTGAVGGVCAAQANTFTALQTFTAGISAAGSITFNGPVTGATATFIRLLTASGGISASGGMTLDGGKVWHSLNDGPNSALDAGQLYGVSASFYASSLSTGLEYGGLVTINAGNSAAFDISAGAGYIVTTGAGYTSGPTPVITKVFWTAKSGVTLSGLTAQDTTWIYFDSSGNLQQQPAFFTDNQVQSTIAIGALVHPSRSFISLARTIPNVSYATDKQYEQFIRAFGPLKVSGHTVQPNGANLKLNRTSGTAFILGRNYPNDPDNPSVVSDVAKTDAEIWRYYRGATAGSFVTVTGTTAVDPGKYDNGTGTLASVSPSKPFTIQRLFFFPNTPDVLAVYYGRAEYASLAEAANNIALEDFTEITNTATNAVLVGYLIVKYNETNLTTGIAAGDARIIEAGQFRSTTSGGGTVATNLDSLNDVIISSVQDDDVLIYDTATSQWLNTPLQHIGVTRVNGLSGAVQAVSSFNGATGAIQGVSSVNGQTGAVTIASTTNVVTSFNGLTGAVTGVSSVNGQTGAVTIASSTNVVTSVNGLTGEVQAVSSFNGATGAVSFVNYVGSFNGATGAVTGVSRVNGLSGGITLAAGTGITFTTSGNTITLAATASGGSTNSTTQTLDFSEDTNGVEIVFSGNGESLGTSLRNIETLSSISVAVNGYTCKLVSLKSFYDALSGWSARVVVKPPFTGGISAETIYLEGISSVAISGYNGVVLLDDTWTSIDSSNIYHQEETYVVKTVTGQTWVTADSYIECKVLGITTADHTPEDAILEGVKFEINNIVAGTGFDIIGHAPEGTYGKYTIKCLGQ